MSARMLFPFPEHMQTWVVDRLKKSPLLDVSAGGPVNRAEAVKLAKAETEAFIVFVQLEDTLLADPHNVGNRPGSGEVWINYYVLSPVSGKTKSSGKVVLSQTGRRLDGSGGVLEACYPTIRGDDYLLLQSSFEVATRVIESFNLPVPPLC